jgi:NADH-quinone oxidoreductase subunit G
MADTVSLTIDGAKVTVPKGTLVVDAAKSIGNDIPVFCYHPKLDPVGMCRMCLVEVGRPQRDRATGQLILDEQGQPKVGFNPKLETACTLPVEEGMVVVGASGKVKEARDDVLEFLLTSHPLDCPICDKGGECPLQNLTIAHGPGQSRFIFDEKFRLAKHVPLGDLIYLDRERCIQCARCVRFQDEVADDHVIGFYERGRHLEIVTFSEPGFDSKFSGNTTDICPVGALTTADFRFGARPWELNAAASICPHCPVGCNLTLNTRREAASGGQTVIKRVMPRQNEQVNEIWICDKGRFGHHFVNSPDRLTTPLVRQGSELVPATWDEALNVAAAKLKAAGSNVAGLIGDRLSNEDLYTFRQVVTGLGGRAEGSLRMGGGEQAQRSGVGVGTNLGNLGPGTVILIVASDLEEEAPVWWLRIKQAAEKGATLIVANGRATKSDRLAKHIVRYQYGHEVATVLGMLVTGTSEAAEVLARSENVVILFGHEGLDLAGSTALAQACENLLIATNHVGRVNNGLIPVWPHNNSQGAWDMGLRPADAARIKDQAQARWIAGADPVGDSLLSAAELRLGGFVLVQELFLTETAKAADVVLPAASWAEREGTYTNGERRVQRFYPAVTMKGRPDFQIIGELGERLGVKVAKHAASVLLDIAANVPAYAGLSYPKLAEVVPQFPDVGGRDLYYGGTSYENKQGLGVQVPAAAERGEALTTGKVSAPPPAEGSGLTVVPTTVLYDRGGMFVRSAVMHSHLAQPYVELNSLDAERLGIQDGDTLQVSGDGLEATLTARVDGRAPEGVALMPESLGAVVPPASTRATVRKG